MKYLIWLLGLFGAAAALTLVLHNTGYVILVYPPYRIELSLILFVVLFLLAFLSGYGLVRLVLTTLQLPSYVREFRLLRAQTRSRKLLDEALGAFFEGHYAAAEKAAARAMDKGEASPLLPIVAARAAHELREYHKRDGYLSTGGKKIGDTTMRLMATAKFMLDQHNPGAALNALRELGDSGVKGHPGAMSLELKAQQQAGHWDEVLSLLDKMEKRKSIDAVEAAQLRQQAWLEKIRQQEDLSSLTTCLKSIPAGFKRRSQIVATAARALIQHGGYALAQQLLSDSLNRQWDSDLVALYGDCQSDPQSGDAGAQIEQAEKWLKHHTQDAELLLALGKLCMHQKLWGKAQNYLDACISIQPGHTAYTALGQLAKQMGKSDQASKYFQSATAVGK